LDKEWVAVIARIYPAGYKNKDGWSRKMVRLERIHGQEVPLAEAQLEEQEGEAYVSPGLDASVAGGARKQNSRKD